MVRPWRECGLAVEPGEPRVEQFPLPVLGLGDLGPLGIGLGQPDADHVVVPDAPAEDGVRNVPGEGSAPASTPASAGIAGIA